MTKTIKNKILNIEYPGRKIFCSLALSAILFSGLYLYFLNGAIANVVEREKTEKEIASLNSRISDLESAYLLLTSKISFDYAISRGFVKLTKEKYVSRKSLSANVSLSEFR